MYNGKTFLGMILARGGSKGIPRKNLVDVGGRPLVSWAVECGLQSQHIDRLLFSTEDQEIHQVATSYGANPEYMRPPELAGDDTPVIDCVLHALDWAEEHWSIKPDAVVLLQPTSPLRTVDDVDGCIRAFVESGKESMTSVHEMLEHPYECVVPDAEGWHYLAEPGCNYTRRQDYDTCAFYFINGAVYINSVEFLRRERLFIKRGETGLYIMPQERGIDVDTGFDLRLACGLMGNGSNGETQG